MKRCNPELIFMTAVRLLAWVLMVERLNWTAVAFLVLLGGVSLIQTHGALAVN